MLVKNRKNGFTLIELLVVAVILGILMGFLSTALMRSLANGKKEKAKSDVKTLGSAVWSYRQEYGRWPTDAKTGTNQVYYSNNRVLIDYMMRDHNSRNIGYISLPNYKYDNGDPVTGNIVDSWQTPIKFTINLDNDEVSVRSAGPNRKFDNNSDDIEATY